MNYETVNLNISLVKSIGEISDKKIKRIIESGYDLIQNVNGVMAHFIEKSSGTVIALAQNQITIGANSSIAEELLRKPEAVVATFDKFLDILFLDGNNSSLQLKLERVYPSEKNTLEQGKGLTHVELFEGALSVGLRIPFKRADFGGELKIEPVFNNAQRYFMDCVIQTENYSVESLMAMVDVIEKEFQPMARRLYS